MSLAIFPSEIGQDVQGQNRWSFRLPIKKTPSYKALRAAPASNRGSLRISLTQYPIWTFELDLAFMRGDMTPAQLNSAVQVIVGFFGQMQGSADDWLYFDPWDNGSNLSVSTAGLNTTQLTYNQVGIGDGVTNVFQMVRTVAGMKDLIQNFVTGYPLIFVGGVQQATNAYSIDAFGNLIVNIPPVPGAVVSWFGQFYFRCHFLDDEWKDLQANLFQLWSNSSFRFESLLR